MRNNRTVTRTALAKAGGIDRRELLIGAGAAVGAAALWSRGALGQTGNLNVGLWGGDYQNLFDANVTKPFLASKGLNVQYEAASGAPRKNKLLAERRLPRGTMDVACLNDIESYEMQQAGVIDQLDPSKIPNSKNVIPALAKPYSMPHIVSGMVLVFNPAHMDPKSFADVWDPKYANKIGLADGNYSSNILFATLAAGGNVSDLEPGKKKLMELKKLGVRVYPTNEGLAQALQSGEIWFTPMWRARANQWRNAGIPVVDRVATEGIYPITFEVVLPKNSQNKEGAYALMNAMLEPAAQVGFAEKMGYVPTVTNAELPANLRERLAFSAEEQKKFLKPDLDYMARNNNALKDWWDREFLG
ncbi:MAG TPA: extracellular solute-binding protein [Azospirillaceae bacterium]|nr:extracellular solute-binding protein [Azospirillaceae bacterium]